MLRPSIVPFLFILALSACTAASRRTTHMGEYYTPRVDDFEQVVSSVQLRNNTIERHPAWITLATRMFMIKHLNDIARSDYVNYRQYLDRGTLYIIVHPAYYVFFHSRDGYESAGSPLDAFLSEHFFTKEMRFLQEQERALRDFLEITSARKRLVLLILPDGNEGHAHKSRVDEYTRYINSVTNGAESVIYLFSEKPNRGSLPRETEARLHDFIEALAPERILIGGGYVGRCVDEFCSEFSARSGNRWKTTVAGEISAFSPEDLPLLDLDSFLDNGILNIPLLQNVGTSGDGKDNCSRDILKNRTNSRKAPGEKG